MRSVRLVSDVEAVYAERLAVMDGLTSRYTHAKCRKEQTRLFRLIEHYRGFCKRFPLVSRQRPNRRQIERWYATFYDRLSRHAGYQAYGFDTRSMSDGFKSAYHTLRQMAHNAK